MKNRNMSIVLLLAIIMLVAALALSGCKTKEDVPDAVPDTTQAEPAQAEYVQPDAEPTEEPAEQPAQQEDRPEATPIPEPENLGDFTPLEIEEEYVDEIEEPEGSSYSYVGG